MPDRHRPLYHFTCHNWLNDVIPFFHDGTYHVFFDHNTQAAEWNHLTSWGHAFSRDLAHWEQWPDAFAPTPGGPDADGCWTGCVIEHDGQFYAFYTGIQGWGILPLCRQNQCLAQSRDLWTWEKHTDNPLIGQPPPGFGECFRDPQVWREGDEWLMLLGSELPDKQGGAPLLYLSRDLLHWEYLHPLFITDPAQTGHDTECPDFFALDSGEAARRHVFLSSRGKTWWQVGDYEDRHFTPEKIGATDTGNFYAAKTTLDGQGRRLLFGWITEGRPKEEHRAAGWAGAISLPRVLSLLSDGALGFTPAPEIAKRRAAHWSFAPTEIAEGEFLLNQVVGDTLEIRAVFEASNAEEFGLLALCTPDGAEKTQLAYNRHAPGFADVPLSGELELRVFVDRSIIEVFAGRPGEAYRACHTLRVYTERDDALRFGLFARGGTAKLKELDVWTMV